MELISNLNMALNVPLDQDEVGYLSLSEHDDSSVEVAIAQLQAPARPHSASAGAAANLASFSPGTCWHLVSVITLIS